VKKIYVCSPFRGPGGQPSPTNIALARRLMKAVFDSGNAPFVPHLLYPQVLSESKEDLALSFGANFAFLTSCHEIWVWARRIEECSTGMKLEVDGKDQIRWRPRVMWMPDPFLAVEREGWRAEVLGRPGLVPGGAKPSSALPWRQSGPTGTCAKCARGPRELNREGWCLECFSFGGAPA